MGIRVIDGQPVETRTVFKLGDSLGITLPFSWVLAQGLEKGDIVTLEETDNQLIIRVIELKKRV